VSDIHHDDAPSSGAVSIGRLMLSRVNTYSVFCVKYVRKEMRESTDPADTAIPTVPRERPLGSLCHLSVVIDPISTSAGAPIVPFVISLSIMVAMILLVSHFLSSFFTFSASTELPLRKSPVP
jgi:hypothetical protein